MINFPEAVGKLSDLELLEDEYDGALVRNRKCC